MSFENSKQHSYWGLGALGSYIGGFVGGPLGWFLGKLAAYALNWLASKGVYFVNVTKTKIETNMDKKTWEKVAGSSWDLKDKINAGEIVLNDEQIKKESSAFRKAFRKHAMYGSVSNGQAK